MQVTCFQERSPCSAHQRFEDFFYRTKQCAIEYRQADLYVPPNSGNLIQKILNKPYGFVSHFGDGRSYNQEFAARPQSLSKRLGVKLASVGLAAVNIFREIVQSPRVVWESLNSPVSRNLPKDVQQNNIAGGFYYNNRNYARSYNGPPVSYRPQRYWN